MEKAKTKELTIKRKTICSEFREEKVITTLIIDFEGGMYYQETFESDEEERFVQLMNMDVREAVIATVTSNGKVTQIKQK